MRFVNIIILFSLFNSCVPKTKKEVDKFENCVSINLLPVSFRNSIDSITIKYYSKARIISVSLSRLSTNTIVCVRPVFDSTFISDKGMPLICYESENRLYLIYFAIEALLNDNNSALKIRKMYDSTCKVNRLEGLNSTNDLPTSFFKIVNGSLEQFNNLNFENVYFERVLYQQKIDHVYN